MFPSVPSLFPSITQPESTNDNNKTSMSLFIDSIYDATSSATSGIYSYFTTPTIKKSNIHLLTINTNTTINPSSTSSFFPNSPLPSIIYNTLNKARDSHSLPQSSHSKRKHRSQPYIRMPIYAEIGTHAERFLKDLLNPCISTLNYSHIPYTILPINECQYTYGSICLSSDILHTIVSYLPMYILLQILHSTNASNASSNAKYSTHRSSAADIHLQKRFNDYSISRYPILESVILRQCYDRRYVRNCSHHGFNHRNIVWPWLICDNMDMYEYHQLYINTLVKWRMIESGNIDCNNSVLKDLQKDVRRTFTVNRETNLSESQKRSLQTMLGVYALVDTEVGYVQGMNFIAGLILFVVKDELNAFGILCHLMKRNVSAPVTIDAHINHQHRNIGCMHARFQAHAYCGGGRVNKTGMLGFGLRDLFVECLPGTVICLSQFEQLVQLYFPELYQHLKVNEVKIESFAAEWFMTLYSYVMPFQISLRIFDMFMVDGYKSLHRIGLGLLSFCEPYLLTVKTDEILTYLKSIPVNVYSGEKEECVGDLLIECALTFKVTNSKLHECAAHLLAKTMSYISQKKYNNTKYQ